MASTWKSVSLKSASLLAAGIFAAAVITPSAHAQVGVGVYIGRTPPPLRYEARPPVPGPGYTWVDGFTSPGRAATVGIPVTGIVRPSTEPTGFTLITTTIRRAGTIMKATGPTRTAATTTSGIARPSM